MASVDFTLLSVGVEDLSGYIQGRKFAHIEVRLLRCFAARNPRLIVTQTSSIADRRYLGPGETLRLLMPMLQNPSANPHATLITLFMTGEYEMFKTCWEKEKPDTAVDEATLSEYQRAAQYMGLTEDDLANKTPRAAMIAKAISCVRDGDPYFKA